MLFTNPRSIRCRLGIHKWSRWTVTDWTIRIHSVYYQCERCGKTFYESWKPI